MATLTARALPSVGKPSMMSLWALMAGTPGTSIRTAALMAMATVVLPSVGREQTGKGGGDEGHQRGHDEAVDVVMPEAQPDPLAERTGHENGKEGRAVGAQQLAERGAGDAGGKADQQRMIARRGPALRLERGHRLFRRHAAPADPHANLSQRMIEPHVDTVRPPRREHAGDGVRAGADGDGDGGEPRRGYRCDRRRGPGRSWSCPGARRPPWRRWRAASGPPPRAARAMGSSSSRFDPAGS